jgi:hypothetical protein
MILYSSEGPISLDPIHRKRWIDWREVFIQGMFYSRFDFQKSIFLYKKSPGFPDTRDTCSASPAIIEGYNLLVSFKNQKQIL